MNELKDYCEMYSRLKIHQVLLQSILEDGSCTCHKGKSCPSKGKHPKTKNGLKDASTNWKDFESYLESPSNIGILTGKESDLEVIDIDPKNGGIESLKKLLKEHDLMTQTVVLTGSGGLHLYYKYSDLKFTNRANILPGIDFKTDGGYVVAPPSIHSSGKQYKFIKDFSFEKYFKGEYND